MELFHEGFYSVHDHIPSSVKVPFTAPRCSKSSCTKKSSLGSRRQSRDTLAPETCRLIKETLREVVITVHYRTNNPS